MQSKMMKNLYFSKLLLFQLIL